MNEKRKNTQKNLPDISRPDAGVVLVSMWKVNDPVHLSNAGHVAFDIWNHLSWPAGLLSHSVLSSQKGNHILQYSQWTEEKAIDAFRNTHLAQRARLAYQAIPGLERLEAIPFQFYRSMLSDNPRRTPSCIVAVNFSTDGPYQQNKLVDGLVERVEKSTTPPHPGMIASYFHHSKDGKRVLNLAAFTTAKAHDEVLQEQLQDEMNIPQFIQSISGVVPLGYERFNLQHTKQIKLTK